MVELNESQTCPHCGYKEDDGQANWDGDSEQVDCHHCNKKYSTKAVYQFLGFESQKICEECEEIEEDCYCEQEESQ